QARGQQVPELGPCRLTGAKIPKAKVHARARGPETLARRDQATLAFMCLNILSRASSSISALKLNLSFSAIARAAAGRAEISSTKRLTCGYFVNTSSPSTNGARRAQPQSAMSTIV